MQTLHTQSELNDAHNNDANTAPSAKAIREMIDIIPQVPRAVQPPAWPKFFWIGEDGRVVAYRPASDMNNDRGSPRIMLTSGYQIQSHQLV